MVDVNDSPPAATLVDQNHLIAIHRLLIGQFQLNEVGALRSDLG